jgi:hypothetical protein
VHRARLRRRHRRHLQRPLRRGEQPGPDPGPARRPPGPGRVHSCTEWTPPSESRRAPARRPPSFSSLPLAAGSGCRAAWRLPGRAALGLGGPSEPTQWRESVKESPSCAVGSVGLRLQAGCNRLQQAATGCWLQAGCRACRSVGARAAVQGWMGGWMGGWIAFHRWGYPFCSSGYTPQRKAIPATADHTDHTSTARHRCDRAKGVPGSSRTIRVRVGS